MKLVIVKNVYFYTKKVIFLVQAAYNIKGAYYKQLDT